VTGQPTNQLVQHPPLYYLLGAAVLSAYPDWENAPFDRVFLVLRLWNALIMAAVPILLWATARRLELPEPVPIAAALVPLAVPEFTHLASSVNDDNLLILLAAGLTLLVARVLTGDTGRRTAVAIGALASLALLTKGFALMIPAWVGLAYLVAAVRSRRRTALTSLAIAELATVPGLLWWIRNEVLYGAVQPNGYFVEQPDLTSRFGWSDGGAQWLRTFVDRMVTLFFVHDQTGQQLHHWPWRMAYVALALGVVAVVTVLAWPVLPRMTTAVLLVPAAALAAIVVTGSWDVFAATQAYGGMQGRYLYSGLAGLGVVAVAAGAVLPRQVRRFLPLALFGFACVIQVVYLTYTLNLFWAPSGSSVAGALREIVRAMAYWYPLPAPVLGVFGGLLAALVIAVTAAVARIAVAVPNAVVAWDAGSGRLGSPVSGGRSRTFRGASRGMSWCP